MEDVYLKEQWRATNDNYVNMLIPLEGEERQISFI